MASHSLAAGGTVQPLPSRGSPASCWLLHLPAPLFELVLQHLSLAQQLNHCSHLCYRLPPPTANSLRYSPLLLNDDVVRSLSQSPRLLALLTKATNVVLQFDGSPATSLATELLSNVSATDLLFPSLASFTYTLSHSAWMDGAKRTARHPPPIDLHGPHQPPLSTACLIPFLVARRDSLHSLCIEHRGPHKLQFDIDASLAPLSSLRRLYVAVPLSGEDMTQLLTLPLDVLDLSKSVVGSQRQPGPPPPASSVDGCVLLQSCRVLRLPQEDLERAVSPAWLAYLDAIVTARTASGRLHTLSVQHTLSAAATEQLLASPPSHSLTVAVLHGNVLSQAAVTKQFLVDGVVPHQLRLSIVCGAWPSRSMLQPLIDFVGCYQPHFRSIKLTSLPHLERVASEVLMVVSHCANLRTLTVSGWPDWPRPQPRWPDFRPSQTRWAERSQLALHSFTLDGLQASEADVCRLLSACPSLRACKLGLLELSVGMLHALSCSCPLLRHLQLDIADESALASTVAPAVEGQPAARPFRSLTQLDLYLQGTAIPLTPHSNGPLRLPTVVSNLITCLFDSPLRQLRLAVRCNDGQYQPALMPLLMALPRLERLQTGSSRWQPVDTSLSITAWDDTDVEETQAGHTAATPPPPSAALASSEPALPAAAPPATSAASSASSASSLRSLDLRVSSALLPVEHLAALLSHCPAVTSIRLTVHAQDGLLLLFLHCLGCIGLHCPLIEDVTFELDPPGMPTRMHVAALSVDEVRAVVDACQLPAGAFGALRCVCEVGDVVQALSAEAASYVRRRWLSGARAGAVLDWHKPQSE